MPLLNVGPDNALGFADKVIGLGKELTGEVIGRKDMVEAGEAQQAKGSEKLKALRAQAEAKAHEAKSETFEAQEKAAQQAKAS